MPVIEAARTSLFSFREFVMALSAASVVNRVRLVETLFHVFDLDSDGKITREEIGKMLHTLVDVTHSNRKHRHPHSIQPDQTKESDLQRRIDDAFNELNGNDDDHITKDEFIDWYMKSGLLSAATSNEISVRDTSRLQQLGRRSRKVNKQRLENGKKSEDGHTQAPRHLSQMLERRAKIPRPAMTMKPWRLWIRRLPNLQPPSLMRPIPTHRKKMNDGNTCSILFSKKFVRNVLTINSSTRSAALKKETISMRGNVKAKRSSSESTSDRSPTTNNCIRTQRLSPTNVQRLLRRSPFDCRTFFHYRDFFLVSSLTVDVHMCVSIIVAIFSC